MSSPAEYDPALAPLSWLMGKWESVEAEVFYPTIETVQHTEAMEYLPASGPVLEYMAETWHPTKHTKLHCERGFLRIDPETQKLALMSAHHYGICEIAEGTVENESLVLESKSFCKMSFYFCADTVKVVRKLTMKGEDLIYTVDLQTDTQPLQPHLLVKYRKKE